MKKGYRKILILEIVFLVILLFNSFVFKIANMYEIIGLLIPFLGLTIFLLGHERNNQRNKKDVLLNILIFILMYYFITYFLGLFSGFLRSPYSFNPIAIIQNIFPVVVIIVLTELLRYELFSKIEKSIPCLIIGIIVFVMIDVNVSIHLYDMTKYAGIVKLICLVVFPSITKNIFLVFLTKRVGYSCGLIYRLLTELNVYLIPISPDFGEYLNILIKTVLPVIIMVRLNNMYNYFEVRKIKTSRYYNKNLIIYSIITFALLVTVVLTSGLFKYQALTIGSSSMAPKIEIGDVVILGKVNSMGLEKIKKGDILVYNHDNVMIVHRVTKKIKTEGKIYFQTKGDNNETKDGWLVREEDVIGTVRLKIKFIGIPTVALNNLLNK